MEHLALIAANLVNPGLVLLFLALLWVDTRPLGAKVTHIVLSIITISVAMFFAEYAKSHVLLPGHSGFPSGHETFAMSTLLCLTYWRPSLWWIIVPAGTFMGWVLKKAQFHDALDIVGAALLSGTVCFLSYLLCSLVSAIKRYSNRVPT